jgi:hypothetical protein
MALRFTIHYTRDEARALLPIVRGWLDELDRLGKQLKQRDAKLAQLLAEGNDLGGPSVNQWVKTVADIQSVMREFENRQIQIKDLERGLVDFPAFVGGQEVFLCWEKDEDDIEFWHDLDSGYAGRERI